jgi:hypothetical protein
MPAFRGYFARINAATWEVQWEVLRRNIRKRPIHMGSVRYWPFGHHPVKPGGQGSFVPDRLEEALGGGSRSLSFSLLALGSFYLL